MPQCLFLNDVYGRSSPKAPPCSGSSFYSASIIYHGHNQKQEKIRVAAIIRGMARRRKPSVSELLPVAFAYILCVIFIFGWVLYTNLTKCTGSLLCLWCNCKKWKRWYVWFGFYKQFSAIWLFFGSPKKTLMPFLDLDWLSIKYCQ